MIGCRCPVCTSDDPRNRRLRTSAAVRLGDRTVLIDTTPELRIQALTYGLDRVDAVCYTHGHADHIAGFDDLRRFSELAEAPLPVWAAPATLDRLQQAFAYALTDGGFGLWGIPVVEWHALDGPVELWGHRLTPVAMEHGGSSVTGFRFDSPEGESLAWCPDCVAIPEAAAEALRGLDVLFLDGLRHTPHIGHFTVAQAVAEIRRLAPRRAYLIHMTHDLDHAATEASLPAAPEVPGGIRLAYDGLVVEV